MPQLKSSFARLTHTDPAQLEPLVQRLRKIGFELGEGHRVIGIDRRPPEFTMQVVMRRLREARHFDEAQDKFVAENVPVDRELYFNVDLRTGLAGTPGGKRDFAVLIELLKRAGAGRDLEAHPLVIDVHGWLLELLKMYETAQLAQVVIDSLFVEPRMIGRYSAKSVDNRLDLDYIQRVAGQLRSIRLGLFHDGVRRTVEARTDGTLVITSSDEEDAEHFFSEQRQVLLSHQIEASVENAIV